MSISPTRRWRFDDLGKPGFRLSHFPFGAVVGQDEAKLALVLAAVEPAIGGVLLRGQRDRPRPPWPAGWSVNRVEREGVSHTHLSRFVVIGSMNPEGGDLRPQLLDRFGLAADVLAPADPAQRAEAVRRRMAFDADPAAFAGAWPDEPLPAHPPPALPDELVHRVSALCASVGAEGLRADLVICRAAAALAGLEGRGHHHGRGVRRVAPLALAHGWRRQPFDDPGMAPDD